MKRAFGFSFWQKGSAYRGHKVGKVLQIGKWIIGRSSFSAKPERLGGKVWWSNKSGKRDLVGP